jgi:hypothetical protein
MSLVAVLLSSLAGAPASAAAPPSYDQVVMMPLSSLGSTDDAAEAIQRVLVAEIGAILGDRLIPPETLARASSEIREGLTACDGVVECLVELVGGAGWDAFIVGNVAGLGEDRAINLKLIDVRLGREVRRTAEKASGDEARLIVQMRKAAVELVAPGKFAGALELVARQEGVAIVIDGTPAGVTPLATTRLELTAGRHALEAKREGYVPFSTMVEIAYGEVKQVTIDLPLSTAFVGGETPYRYRWWTWAMAGAGVLGVGLGVYFNTLHIDGVESLERRNETGLSANDADTLEEARGHRKRSLIFYGVGGAFLLGTAALWSLDLF